MHFVSQPTIKRALLWTRRLLIFFCLAYSQYTQAQINLTYPVGSVPGQASTSPAGAAGYSIPIDLPKGPNQLTPQLTLVYNSLGGDGFYGWGWDLDGISVIRRSGKTVFQNGLAQPVTYYSADDVFTLDGNRLTVTSGTNGANGAIYAGESENFSKIESIGGDGNTGPQGFRVTTKNGLIMEYGMETTSIMFGQGHNATVFVAWFLNKITDTYGNYITYIYNDDELSSNRIIQQITYGSNTTAAASACYSVSFRWSTRTDETKVFEAGVPVSTSFRLMGIDVMTIKPAAAQIRQYDLAYTTIQGQSFLQSVTQGGLGGTSVSKLNPTTFEYGTTSSTPAMKLSTAYSFNGGEDCISGDFDGDGMSDIMRATYKFDANNVKYHTGYTIYTGFTDVGLSQISAYTIPASSGATQEVLSANKRYTLYNFLANDFDGDGKDDVVMLNTSYETSTQRRTFNKLTLNYSRFYSAVTGLTCKTTDYTSVPTVSGLTFKYLYAGGQYYIPGDFDGDGNQDYILILGANGTNSFKAFLSCPKKGVLNAEIANFGAGNNDYGTGYYATTVAAANSVIPIDFNGDGRTELLVTRGTTSYVVSVSPVAPSSGYLYAGSTLYQTSAIAAGYRIYPGDFNGDGNTDLLVRPSANVSDTYWQIHYSTGISLLTPTANVPFAYTVILPKDGSYTSAHHLMVADLNRDGKSDILHLLDQGGNVTRYAAYYSVGQNTFSTETNTIAGATNGESELTGDFNSDGKTDCGTLTGLMGQIVQIYPFKQDRLLTKVTNGLGHVTTFNYGLLSNKDGQNIYQRSTTYDYDNQSNQSTNHTDYTVPRLPVYAVSLMGTSNGIGGTNTTSYLYTDAVMNTGGRGFLGFKKLTAIDNTTLYVTTTTSDINTQFMMPYVTKQNVTHNGQTFTESQFTTSFVARGTGTFDKRNFRRIDKIISINNASGNAVEISNTFDNYGNMTSRVAKSGYLSGTTVTPQETTTINTTFSIHNTPIPALPDNVTTISLRAGQPQLTKVKAYTYNDKGRLATSVDFSGESKAVTTTLTYDAFGNVAQSVLSATGLSSRTTKYTYDVYGISLTKKELLDAGVSRSETYAYHPSLKMVTTYVSFDGLTTTYDYDNYGNTKTINKPEGYSISLSRQWETSDGRYSVLSSQAGGAPDVKIWYDILGREVKRQTLGYNSQWLTQTQQYDAKGNITGTTNPYYSTETPVSSTTTYDQFNRPTYTGNSTRSVTTAYATPGNGQCKVTNTISGKTTSRTTDGAGRLIAATDNGGELNYTYDSHGNLTQVGYGSSTPFVTKSYDIYDRQTSMTDINAGATTYETNAFGELTKQTDSKGNIYNMTYDNLGRLATRVGPDGTTTYTYWRDATTGYANNLPQKITAASGAVYDYTYDAKRRLQKEQATIDGTAFSTQYTYNTYGDLLTTTYPSGLIESNTVDRNGTVTGIAAGTTGNLSTIFTATAMNSLGAVSGYNMGNGKSSTIEYNLTIGAPKRYYTPGIQDLSLTFDGATGNLTGRNDAIAVKNETFGYDYLDRLTTVTLNNTVVSQISFDGGSGTSLGNIASKTDAGNYRYNDNKKHMLNYIVNPAGATTPPAVISTNQQTLTYTPFGKIATINQNTYDWSFVYDYSDERIKSTLKQNNVELERKYYLGNFERQVKGSITRDIHYIRNANGLCGIVVKEGSTITPYFVYADHLGNILTVTNSAAAIVARQNFDAWGRYRNPADWTYNSLPTQPDWLYRGYTGHEHLPQAALINMNGRLYDPVIGRMLSPDNFTQEPYNTQSYNRYAYAINNPLKYNDPSGNFFLGTVLTAVYDVFRTGFTKGGFEFWRWGSTHFDEAWKAYDPTRSGSMTNNAFKIDMGFFKGDENKSFMGQVWQVITRNTWEMSQQNLGNAITHFRNFQNQISSIEYYGGATIVNYNIKDKAPSGATIGNYINGINISANVYKDDLVRHEYGHTIQSRILGPFYLSRVALPSFVGYLSKGKNGEGHNHHREWEEVWANQLALDYFEKFDPDVLDRTKGGQSWDKADHPLQEFDKDWFYYLFPPSIVGFK